MSRYGFGAKTLRASVAFAVAGLLSVATTRGVVITNVNDGFGDGDRDNNGLDSGATATDPLDVGIPWLLTDGTSAVNFRAIDDSGGINTGNALQLNNTGSNNRPAVGHFSPVTLADGDKLVLRFDMRLVSATNLTTGNPQTSDRVIRWGLYRDTNNDDGTVDHGSTGSVSVDDVGYNVRIDALADASNSTTMDVTRDDTPTGTAIIQATTTGIGVASTNAADQMTDALSHHFELSLLRSGTGLVVTLQKDSNPAISNTDATPTGFVFDEVALGLRNTSSVVLDVRFDNIQVEYTPAPEPASFALLTLGAAGALLRRRARR